MRNYIYIITLLIAALSTACDSQLEQVPSKQQDIIPTDVKYLQGFLSSSDYKHIHMNPIVVMSDDYVALKSFQEKSSRTFVSNDLQYPITWGMEELTLSTKSDDLWENEYSKIYIANTILDYLPEVNGTEEEKKRLRGDAHFIRAYSYFILTSTYGLPYKADGSNKDEMGVSIYKAPSLSTYPERSSMEECYTFILEDLKAAEEELADIPLGVAPVGNIAQWKASIPAVYSLMAKVYLTIGNFEQAKVYAQKALDNNGAASLVNFDTEMSYASDNVNQTVEVMEEEDVVKTEVVKFPMTRNFDFGIYSWRESYFRRFVEEMNKVWLVPSDELVALYGADETEREYDLRWKYFYVENYSYTDSYFQGGGDPFKPAEKIVAYKGLNIVGPSVAEMYLIKAECQARGTEGYAKAQETINKLRANRFAGDTPAAIRDLSFTSKEDAIQKIINERRREMPFYSRWYDLKRLAANGDFDYIPNSITREFYEVTASSVGPAEKTYTFSPQADFRKFAYPIPNKDIQAAAKLGATVTQNTY